jgi:hypothetical protein
MRSIKRETLPIESIIANPRNDRIHDQAQLDLLKESLQKFGQARPLLVRAANRMIIGGHGVWEAAKQLGWDRIDVLLWDVDQPTADMYLVADNRLGELSDSDPPRRLALLQSFDETDWPALGFLPEDVEALLGGTMQEVEVREIETSPVADRFWISIHGDLKDQAAVLKRLQEAMADLPGVTVELGTISG